MGCYMSSGSVAGAGTRRIARSDRRLAATWLFSAAGLMALGGVIKRVTGVDLDAALSTGEIGSYLVAFEAHQAWLTVNLAAWTAGVFLFGLAGASLAQMGQRRPLLAEAGLACYWTGVPLAIGAFIAWLAMALRMDPGASQEMLSVVEGIGWWASRADWIATVLLVGLGPLLLSLAGRDDWAPRWLVWFSVVAGVGGLVTTVSLFTGGLTTYGQAIIPVGLGWTIAAGVVLWRG